MKITGKQVKDFWAFMEEKYGFTTVQKADAAEMHAIGWFLDAIGVQSHGTFMSKFTTTIGMKVYVPFKIGVGKQSQLLNQIATCVHEAQHVIQFSRNPARFVARYAANDAARSHYEADAYRCTMEMYYYLTGKLLSPVSLASALKGYGVGAADIKVTRKHLAISKKVIALGYIISSPSKEAIKWWRRRAKSTGIKTNVRFLQG